MIRLGLVYGNLMSNLRANNEKLVRRAHGILAQETGLDAEESARVFEASGGDLKLALLMARAHLPREDAGRLLQQHSGSVRRALDSLK
jgi:N-acetylmuramic acid 6-phosphate etherase